jgi:ABC-type proline/glycine betaine transport system permease subunit
MSSEQYRDHLSNAICAVSGAILIALPFAIWFMRGG